MAFKYIAIVAFIGAASASLAPLPLFPIEESRDTVEEHNSYPQYTYTYGVTDTVSGDSKSQTETRNGDIVHGEYSLNDADGYKRTVKYTADDVNGFNAVVDREPIVEKEPVAVTPVVVKTADPLVTPVTYTSVPTASIAYTAPSSLPAIHTHSVFKPTLTYTSGPVVYKSLPLAYGAHGLYNSIPLAYAGHPTYTVKSLPSAYQLW